MRGLALLLTLSAALGSVSSPARAATPTVELEFRCLEPVLCDPALPWRDELEESLAERLRGMLTARGLRFVRWVATDGVATGGAYRLVVELDRRGSYLADAPPVDRPDDRVFRIALHEVGAGDGDGDRHVATATWTYQSAAEYNRRRGTRREFENDLCLGLQTHLSDRHSFEMLVQVLGGIVLDEDAWPYPGRPRDWALTFSSRETGIEVDSELRIHGRWADEIGRYRRDVPVVVAGEVVAAAAVPTSYHEKILARTRPDGEPRPATFDVDAVRLGYLDPAAAPPLVNPCDDRPR